MSLNLLNSVKTFEENSILWVEFKVIDDDVNVTENSGKVVISDSSRSHYTWPLLSDTAGNNTGNTGSEKWSEVFKHAPWLSMAVIFIDFPTALCTPENL